MRDYTRRPVGLVTCFLLGVAMSVAACGPSTAGSPTSRPQLLSTIRTNETLYLLEGSVATTGAQTLIAVHPGIATTPPLSLPIGLATQDHRRLYIAEPHAGNSTVRVLDLQTGVTVRSFDISGEYATDPRGYGGATLTPDGRWLAMRQVHQTGSNSSTIAMVDTEAEKIAASIHLNGDFDIDALSPDGSALYLIQNLHDAEHHYYVRVYDIGAGKLLNQIIVDKTEINNPKMQGYAVARRLENNGAVAFTLYTNASRDTAFVHVLSLDSADSITPFARCVDDLPASQAAELLRHYTLVLSSDGATFYAVNAALGVATKIATSGGILTAQVAATSHFPPMGSLGAGDGDSGDGLLSNGAALSPDGQLLYVVGAHGLVMIRTSDMVATGSALADHPLTSIAVGSDGKIVYVTDAHEGLLAVSPDGATVAHIDLNGHTGSLSIAWILS